MKFTEFILGIVKSLWAWAGLLMDIIGVIVYAKPDLVEKLSYLNIIQKYWWVWIIIGTLFIIFGAWEVTKNIIEDKKSLVSTPTNVVYAKENNAPILQNSNGNTFTTQSNELKVILPDHKKKENLKRLDKTCLDLANEIMLYKSNPEKQISTKLAANKFFETSQENTVEMSTKLRKLVFDEMFPEIKNNVVPRITTFWGIFELRNNEIASKIESDYWTPLPKIEGVEKRFLELKDEIHDEIYRILNP